MYTYLMCVNIYSRIDEIVGKTNTAIHVRADQIISFCINTGDHFYWFDLLH